MKFNTPKNLLPSAIENQEQQVPTPIVCNTYQPIGTGDCWHCGHHFYEHQKPQQCLGCCMAALTAEPEFIDAVVNSKISIFPHSCKKKS